MEGILRVTPEKLRTTASDFESTGSAVRQITQDMIAVIDSLKSSWEGEAATAYNTRFHELDEDMEKMHRMIAEHVKDLQDMADQYQQAETFNEEAGTSLAGDIID